MTNPRVRDHLDPPQEDPRKSVDETVMPREEAMDRMSAAGLNMLPTFLKNGLIRAGVGYYRMAQHEDGRQSLLFSFKRDNLIGEPIEGKKGCYPTNYDEITEVSMRLRPLNRPWAFTTIINHQYMLSKALRAEGNLYQTDDTTWQSGSVSYKIFPCTNSDNDPQTNDQGQALYSLRMYSIIDEAGDDFVRVDEAAPEGIIGRAFSLGSEKGIFTYDAARDFIANDFSARAMRMRAGKRAVSRSEETQGERDRLWLLKKMEQGWKYLRTSSWKQKAGDIGQLVLKILKGPEELLEMAGEALLEYIKKRWIDDKSELPSNNLRIKKHAPFLAQLLPSVDGRKIKHFRFLNMEESGIKPLKTPIDRKTHRHAKDWIAAKLHGPFGSVVTMPNEQLMTVECPNGVTVDYIADKHVAYGRYHPEKSREKGLSLDPTLQEFFEGADKDKGDVIKVTITDDGLRHSRIKSDKLVEYLSDVLGSEEEAKNHMQRPRPASELKINLPEDEPQLRKSRLHGHRRARLETQALQARKRKLGLLKP